MAAIFLAVWPLPFLAAVPLQAAVPLNNYSGRAAASGRAAEKLAAVPLQAAMPLKNSCKRMNNKLASRRTGAADSRAFRVLSLFIF